MKVYATVYTGKKEVWELDGELLKGYSHLTKLYSYYKKGVGHYGCIYTVQQLFTSEDAAWRDWNRERVTITDHYNPGTGRPFENWDEYYSMC